LKTQVALKKYIGIERCKNFSNGTTKTF